MAEQGGSFKSAWRHVGWRRYVIALTLSTTGDFLHSFALVVYMLDETGSPGWVAAGVISRMAVATVLGPVGGVIADRVDRRRLMVGLDSIRVVLLVLAGWAMLIHAAPGLVLAVITAVAALSAPYRPAAVAATPLLVNEDDLVAANAAEVSVGQLAWFVGPAIGAAIVTTLGPAAACFVTAGMFVGSALLVAGIGNIGGGDDAGREASFVSQFVEGGRALRRVDGLRVLTAIAAVSLFAYGVETVVHVLVVSDRLDSDPGNVGVLAACLGVGGLLAVPFSSQISNRSDTGRLLAIAGVLIGVPTALLAVTSSFVVAGALMVVEGAGNMIFDVLWITLLQRACPEHLLGRVFAIQESAGSLTQLCGTVAAPLLIATVSLEASLWVGGGVLVAASIVLLAPLQGVADRTEAERLALAPVVERLRGVGIFGVASRAALERIARSSVVRRLAPGEVVFQEGETPDDLYVVEAGTVVVSTAAEGEIRRQGPGDWFGEIGLLRGVPRTATVTAADEVRLLAIPGQVFLDAVSAQDRMPDPLGTHLSIRLSRTHPHLVVPAPADTAG